VRTIEFLPYPFLAGLVFLALMSFRVRRRALVYRAGLALFCFYMMAVINVLFFPILVPENWLDNLRWDEIAFSLANTRGVNLIPFNYGRMFSDLSAGLIRPNIVIREIGGNILLTIPFGLGTAFLTRISGWRMIGLALGVGLALEGIQLVFMLIGVGYPHSVDVNDILLNGLGVMIGYGLYQGYPIRPQINTDGTDEHNTTY